MNKPAVKTGKPTQAPVAKTPYGLEPLVNASKKLTDRHVMSDVTRLAGDLERLHPEFSRFVSHTGYLDPDRRIGLTDHAYGFDGEGLGNLNICFYIYRIEGGNGLPLTVGDEKLVFIRMRISTKGWGELYTDHLHAANPEWVEWARAAVEVIKDRWEKDLRAGNLARLTDDLAREAVLSRWQRNNWCREALHDVSTKLALDFQVVDDDQEAQEHASSLEHQASVVHLVTPWLAEKLKARGQVADIVHGLPLWSRSENCEPHLEETLQDIAYETFGSSVDSELASATKAKEQ